MRVKSIPIRAPDSPTPSAQGGYPNQQERLAVAGASLLLFEISISKRDFWHLCDCKRPTSPSRFRPSLALLDKRSKRRIKPAECCIQPTACVLVFPKSNATASRGTKGLEPCIGQAAKIQRISDAGLGASRTCNVFSCPWTVLVGPASRWAQTSKSPINVPNSQRQLTTAFEALSRSGAACLERE